MDLKTHILRWQHEIAENHAILALAIFICVAAVFVVAVIIDAIMKYRRENRRRRK